MARGPWDQDEGGRRHGKNQVVEDESRPCRALGAARGTQRPFEQWGVWAGFEQSDSLQLTLRMPLLAAACKEPRVKPEGHRPVTCQEEDGGVHLDSSHGGGECGQSLDLVEGYTCRIPANGVWARKPNQGWLLAGAQALGRTEAPGPKAGKEVVAGFRRW